MGTIAVPPAEVALELQNLHQLYALLTDLGRTNELAALFTDDAVWDGDELGYGRSEGPEAIAERVTARFKQAEPMVHMPGPLMFTSVSDDEAETTSWCLATRCTEGVIRPVIYFHYEDSMRKAADGTWRFAHRLLRSRFPEAAT
jgi:SnoaL-like domain